MNINRRSFLRQTGILATTPLIINELWSCTPASKTEEKSTDSTATTSMMADPSVKNFGLQLWTVQKEMAADPKGVLKALASYGYKQIESFQGGKDYKSIFWGMSAKEFKTYMDDLGMTLISSHCSQDFTMKKEMEGDYRKLVDDAASIGMKYLINPYLGDLKTQDEWKKAAEGLNRQGEICAKAGLRAAYHNHNFEFVKFADGSMPESILLDGTDPKLVDFEMDLFWVVKAGENPEEWLKKYNNRYKACHIKDLYKDKKVAELRKDKKEAMFLGDVSASCDLGTGKIDFPKILSTAKANGMEYFIVEQERFDGTTPMKAAEANAAYMKKLVFV